MWICMIRYLSVVSDVMSSDVYKMPQRPTVFPSIKTDVAIISETASDPVLWIIIVQ